MRRVRNHLAAALAALAMVSPQVVFAAPPSPEARVAYRLPESGAAAAEAITVTATSSFVRGIRYPATGTIDLQGGFDGKGQRPADVNRLLSYASPSAMTTTLPVVPGRNAVKLSVDGVVGSRTATDTDRLVLVVE